MGFPEPVTRSRRVQVGVDRYKNPVYEEVTTALPDALFAPRDVVPALEPGRSPVVIEPSLYWPHAWPDVDVADRLTVRGVTFEVLSVPADWRGQRVGGLVVKLRDSAEGVP